VYVASRKWASAKSELLFLDDLEMNGSRGW
jgi:hypothetical protein